MTALYHVAPRAALEDILAKGILPMIKQGYRRTEEEAVEMFLDRWCARMGREEFREQLYATARDAIYSIYAFETLEQARKWATDDVNEMIIFEISENMTEYFKQDPENAEGEDGAMIWVCGEIEPEYIRIVK